MTKDSKRARAARHEWAPKLQLTFSQTRAGQLATPAQIKSCAKKIAVSFTSARRKEILAARAVPTADELEFMKLQGQI